MVKKRKRKKTDEELFPQKMRNDVIRGKKQHMINTYQENSLPVPEHKQKVNIPYQVQSVFGCKECEWRGTPMCPEGFSKWKTKSKIPVVSGPHKNVCLDRRTASDGAGGKKREIVIKKGIGNGLFICQKRKDWLRITSPDVPTQSVDKWFRHYNLIQQQIINNKDHHRLRFHLDKLITLEDKKEELSKQGDRLSEPEQEELKELEVKTWKVRNDYTNTWEKLMTFQDKQVDRETVKKIDMEVKHVSMRDIMKQVSDYKEGTVVDADYEVLEDED